MEQDVHSAQICSHGHSNQTSVQDEKNLTEDDQSGSEPRSSSSAVNEERETSWVKAVVMSVWGTAHTKGSKDYRELKLDAVILVMVCILTYGADCSTDFYYTTALKKLFLDTKHKGMTNNFRNLNSIQDFWDFVEGPLMTGLYHGKKGSENRDFELKYEDDIYYKNTLLCAPRLRQLKVRKKTCKLFPAQKDEVLPCYGPYKTNAEDTDSFGKKNGTAWTYQTEETLNGFPYQSNLGVTYSGAGHVQDLLFNEEGSSAAIKDLKSNIWLDDGTRAVFVDFTFYNADIGFICTVRLVAEFFLNGGVYSSWQFRTIKRSRYVSTQDWFLMACQCFYMLLMIIYARFVASEMKRRSWKYLESFWNSTNVLLVVLSLSVFVLKLYLVVKLNMLMDDVAASPSSHHSFTFLGFWHRQYESFAFTIIFFSWIKVLKYMSNPSLQSIASPYLKEVATFALTFLAVFLSFAQVGCVAFGGKLKGFRTLQDSMHTQLRIFLCDYDYRKLLCAEPLLGAAYCSAWLVAMLFLLVNAILTIADTSEKAENLDCDTLRKQPTDNNPARQLLELAEGERLDAELRHILVEKIKFVLRLHQQNGHLGLTVPELKRLEVALRKKFSDLDERLSNFTHRASNGLLHPSNVGSRFSRVGRALSEAGNDEVVSEWGDIDDDGHSVNGDEDFELEDDDSGAERGDDDPIFSPSNLFFKVAILAELS